MVLAVHAQAQQGLVGPDLAGWLLRGSGADDIGLVSEDRRVALAHRTTATHFN